MLNKLNNFLKQKHEQLKKKEELRKAKKYYQFVKAGQVFINFVQQDLKKQGEQVNRHIRRRMERDLSDKGVLSEEIVKYYGQKIEWILQQVEQRLNPPKIKNQNNTKIRTSPPNGYQPKPSTEVGKIIPPQGGTGESKRVA